MSRVVRCSIVLVVALVALPVASAAARRLRPGPRYYLSLGDSLSQGVQPDQNGLSRNTNQGYPEQLLPAARRQIPNIKLVHLGCGGETTTSMITGKGNPDAAYFHCNHPAGGSQLAAAVRFLKAHHTRGEVPLLTLDIGANNIDGCTAPGLTLTETLACVSKGEAAINNDLPKILKALRAAAPRGTRFIGMNLYDVVLGLYLNPATRPLANVSVALAKQLNGQFASLYGQGGFRVADVAGAFFTYDQRPSVPWQGQMFPVNVAHVCSWTWDCQSPPSGPNIHANKNGYAVIAGAFARQLGQLN